jgi:3-oxoacyl-[acyl-carrier protein] reductase
MTTTSEPNALPQTLAGRVCLITGAAQGIGRAVAEGFARRGGRVVATDLRAPEIDSAALSLAWDVAQPQRAAEVVREVTEQLGSIDVFVANAGQYPRQEWDEIAPDEWRRVMEVNLDSAWHGAQEAGRVMTAQGRGKIIFVSSIQVVRGVSDHVHYVAAKAGIIGLTRSLARALGPQGVHINCVMPGAIRTPTELEQFPDQEAVTRSVDEWQCMPGRIESEDIEPVFAFLASSDSDCVTGQIICADKGLVHW